MVVPSDVVSKLVTQHQDNSPRGIYIVICLLINLDKQIQGDIELILNMCIPKLQLIECHSNGDCVKLIENKLPDITLVDSNDVESDISNLIKKIKKIHNHPIIVLSKKKQRNNSISNMGQVIFINKPVNNMELMSGVSTLLKEHMKKN